MKDDVLPMKDGAAERMEMYIETHNEEGVKSSQEFLGCF